MADLTPEPVESFAALLRRRRAEASLTQEELAARAGVGVRTVSDLERGVHDRPQAETARLLADALALTGAARESFLASARARPASPVGWGTPDLPATPQRLIGRDRELALVETLLADVNIRLVTLTGPGGSGKTRLALAFAEQARTRDPRPVAWVDLAPVRDSSLVLAAIARALGIGAGQESPLDQLRRRLHAQPMVLVLDNCEHVLGAAPDLGRLIADCPACRFLATSRERWRILGERVAPIAPLALPSAHDREPERLKETAAVALFLERAGDADSGFVASPENIAAAAAICRRLDGLPLAIELAAGWVAVMPPRALLARLNETLPLLTRNRRDAPARQQTMTEAIAWSYRLLTPAEQSVFRRLGIFVGDWSLESAEAIVAEPGAEPVVEHLGSLIAKSLVQRCDTNEDARFRLLEPVREFASAQLAVSGEHNVIADRHANHYLAVVEHDIVWTWTRFATTQSRRAAEIENLLAALAFLEHSGELDRFVRLNADLSKLWFDAGRGREGRGWLQRALELSPGPTVQRIDLLIGAGALACVAGDLALADGYLDEARDLACQLECVDRFGVVHMFLGLAAELANDDARAWRWYELGLENARAVGDLSAIGNLLANLSDTAFRQGDLDAAWRAAVEAAPFLSGYDEGFTRALNQSSLGQVALARGEVRVAARAFSEALRIALQDRQPAGLADIVACIAAFSLHRGAIEAAATLLGSADELLQISGHFRYPHFGLVDQVRAALTNRMGAEWMQEVLGQGHRLTLDEALALARAELAMEPEATATGGIVYSPD